MSLASSSSVESLLDCYALSRTFSQPAKRKPRPAPLVVEADARALSPPPRSSSLSPAPPLAMARTPSDAAAPLAYRKLSASGPPPPADFLSRRKLSLANQTSGTLAPPPSVARAASHSVGLRRPSHQHAAAPSLARVLANTLHLHAAFVAKDAHPFFAVLQAETSEVPALVLYSATRAQSLLGLMDSVVEQAPAFGPLSLTSLVTENEIQAEVLIASGGDLGSSSVKTGSHFLASANAASTMPQSMLRLSRHSSTHVAENGIFVLQVNGTSVDSNSEETWFLQLNSGDAMMEWLRCIRQLIASL